MTTQPDSSARQPAHGQQPTAPADGASRAAAAMFGSRFTQQTTGSSKPQQQPNPAKQPTQGEEPAEPSGDVPDGFLPKSESDKAFRARDEAKKSARRAEATLDVLLGRLGLSREDLEVVETDGKLDVKGEKVEHVASVVNGHRGNDGPRLRRSKMDAAKDAFINEMAATQPLRTALIEAGCIGEAVDDAIYLLQPRIKAEQSIDEKGKLSVEIEIADEDGSPLFVGGKRGTVHDLVSQYLEKRPHLRAYRSRSGAGTGGRGGTGGSPGRGGGGLEAARKVFGDSYVPPNG